MTLCALSYCWHCLLMWLSGFRFFASLRCQHCLKPSFCPPLVAPPCMSFTDFVTLILSVCFDCRNQIQSPEHMCVIAIMITSRYQRCLKPSSPPQTHQGPHPACHSSVLLALVIHWLRNSDFKCLHNHWCHCRHNNNYSQLFNKERWESYVCMAVMGDANSNWRGGWVVVKPIGSEQWAYGWVRLK